MAVGKLEVLIKINEMPEVKEIGNGFKEIKIYCDTQVVTSKLRPKAFKKLEESHKYPLWLATISGKMANISKDGFELLEPNISVFERKPKEAKVGVIMAPGEAEPQS